ncbi:methyltransferase [Rhizorhabdus dicambivorans]|uniref:Methyltransferase n=1 Tax=Rhizorhabdus dicambivorans TaxID=1850238 RepID=A0A2A4G306_9SPHN|nr:methyltransferase [Rhizorhabdus dicambivorans]ATE65125.1 methyltransferase [Rhizorhabdus dicambivorans]PCE44398.1 methyltransferase [Rhizorhabdus dicambivorans]
MASLSPSPSTPGPDPYDEDALFLLLELLSARGYSFVTPTPATHARVLYRLPSQARDIRDVLGWSLPFTDGLLDSALLEILEKAGALEQLPDGRRRSRYRISSLGGDLYLHSAYPTLAEDSVFFGPDSYRFADLIARELRSEPVPAGGHVVDIGAGAGVGAITAAHLSDDARVTMTDINPVALRLAAINARAAGVSATFVQAADLARVAVPIDVALANPPYIVDSAGRDYRDGGGMYGGQVALDMTREALGRLARGGRMILYTGSAIVRGEDRLRAALSEVAVRAGCHMDYREIDPDIFGEELDAPAYRDVERIAVVGAVFHHI